MDWKLGIVDTNNRYMGYIWPCRVQGDFSSAWLCQQSSWNRNSSVVRASSVVRLWHRLSLKLLHGFLSNFSCGFPWAICPDVCFSFLRKKNSEYFSFSVTWDPMGAKTSKRYSSLKSLLNPFKLFPNFLLIGPDKVVLDFWNLDFLIFQEFC